jgi:hypothetical protein
MNPKSKALKKRISMSKEDFVKEHKKLVKTLKTGKGIKEEYREQKGELDKLGRDNTRK